jgi:hypothetical protein
MAPNSTTVRHITKDHVVIHPADGYSAILFNLAGGNVEAVIAADDGSETIRLLILGPGPTQTMRIKTEEDGTVDIMYMEIDSGR